MFVDSTLYTGRPDERRIDKEERCYDFLASLGIGYQRADHDAAATIEACHDVEKLLGCEICKEYIVTAKKRWNHALLGRTRHEICNTFATRRVFAFPADRGCATWCNIKPPESFSWSAPSCPA